MLSSSDGYLNQGQSGREKFMLKVFHKLIFGLVMFAVPMSAYAQAAPEPLTCNGAAVSFEAGVMPSDWSISTAAAAGGEFVISTNNSSSFWLPGPAPDGSYYASANDDTTGPISDGSSDYLYSNVFNLTNSSAASLAFDYHFNATFGHIAGGVQVSSDGGITWDAEIIVAAGPDWQNHNLDLAAYTGLPTVQVRFHSDDGGAWAAGYGIDNLALSCDIDVPIITAIAIPTASFWGLLLLAGLLLVVAMRRMRPERN